MPLFRPEMFTRVCNMAVAHSSVSKALNLASWGHGLSPTESGKLSVMIHTRHCVNACSVVPNG